MIGWSRCRITLIGKAFMYRRRYYIGLGVASSSTKQDTYPNIVRTNCGNES